MTTLFVDDGALLVHNIVILEQVLTDTEMVLFYLLLCILDAACDHAVLNHLAFLEAKTVHYFCNTLAGEETHQFILDADIEDAAARIALTTGTATQLTIDTTALMAFRTDNGKAACSLYLGREFDVRTTTCHIGGNGDSAKHALVCLYQLGRFARLALFLLGCFGLKACLIIDGCTLFVEGSSVGRNIHVAHNALTCQCHNVCFLLVEFRIQYLMRYLTHL